MQTFRLFLGRREKPSNLFAFPLGEKDGGWAGSRASP